MQASSARFKFFLDVIRGPACQGASGLSLSSPIVNPGLAATDEGFDSTLTISDLLSETNFPVWKHKAFSKFVKSFQKFNFKVIIIIIITRSQGRNQVFISGGQSS